MGTILIGPCVFIKDCIPLAYTDPELMQKHLTTRVPEDKVFSKCDFSNNFQTMQQHRFTSVKKLEGRKLANMTCKTLESLM